MRLLRLLKTAWKVSTGQTLLEMVLSPPTVDAIAGSRTPPKSKRAPSSSSSTHEAAGTGIRVAGDEPAEVEALGSGIHVAGELTAPGANITQLEPRGWLGAMFGHGIACLEYETYYLRHHRHILPSVAASWDSVKDKPETDYSRGTLMTRRFTEWQCPVFDSQSPDFFGARRGLKAADIRSMIAMVAGGDQSFGGGTIYDFVDWSNVRHPSAAPKPRGTRPARNVINWLQWIQSRDHHGKDRRILASIMLLTQRSNNVLEPLPYWSANSYRLLEWNERIANWYWIAQWSVWCVEMMRCHYDLPISCPSWWSAFAGSWGILCRDDFSDARYSAWRIKDGDERHLGVRIHEGRDDWEWFAKKVMQLAGVPGDPDKCGAQIVPDELTAGGAFKYKRHIFDMPPKAGALVPPVRLYEGGWNGYAIGWWAQHTDMYSVWEKFVLPAWSAVCSAVASMAGPQFTAFQATATAIYAVATTLLQAGAAMANGQKPDVSDVVGALGQIAELAGVDGEWLPDDVWEQLRAAAGAFHFAGDTADQAISAAISARAELADLERIWPYVDQGLGGMFGGSMDVGKYFD